jgi:hypothetical protein
MASSYAIAAVGKTILSLLSAAVPKPDFAGATFELYQSKDLQNPMKEGVSLYLHRVITASTVRNLPPRVDLNGIRYKPSLPLDLHYLLIPWAVDAFKQQRLLGWAMRTLEDTPVLNSSLLNQYGPESDTFGENEAVDLLLETLTILEVGAIWDTGKHQMQPSAMYVVRQVILDSPVQITEADRVQTRVFDMGKVVEP